jgi:hypothetical protein
MAKKNGSAILVYNVICQWSKHFRERVAKCPKLTLPKGLSLSFGIGDFHLHGHIQECFSRFFLGYIEGAGIVDGEIVETLWASLNNIAPSTRNASLAHRAEVLNDHMNYSNWKKLTNIGQWKVCPFANVFYDECLASTLHKKRVCVEVYLRENTKAKKGLTEVCSVNDVDKWNLERKEAQSQRKDNPRAMDYFSVKAEEGESFVLPTRVAAPSIASSDYGSCGCFYVCSTKKITFRFTWAAAARNTARRGSVSKSHSLDSSS